MLRGRRELGQDMAVVNQRGSGGAAALMYAINQPRDGYTVLAITESHIFQIVRGRVPLTIDDLVGVARATEDPMIIAVPAGSPIRTMADLLAASSGRDGGLRWGTTITGGADHVAIHGFTKAAGGIPYTVVPFNGGGDIPAGLVGKNIDAALLNFADGEVWFGTGEIRAIASLSEEPVEWLGGAPTARDAGVDSISSSVRGFVVLTGVADDRLAKLEEGMIRAMEHETFQTYLSASGLSRNSVLGRQAWNRQIRRIHGESRRALAELGML